MRRKGGHAIFFGHRGTSVAASVVAYGVALLVSTVDSCWIDGATTSRIKFELFPSAIGFFKMPIQCLE